MRFWNPNCEKLLSVCGLGQKATFLDSYDLCYNVNLGSRFVVSVVAYSSTSARVLCSRELRCVHSFWCCSCALRSGNLFTPLDQWGQTQLSAASEAQSRIRSPTKFTGYDWLLRRLPFMCILSLWAILSLDSSCLGAIQSYSCEMRCTFQAGGEMDETGYGCVTLVTSFVVITKTYVRFCCTLVTESRPPQHRGSLQRQQDHLFGGLHSPVLCADDTHARRLELSILPDVHRRRQSNRLPRFEIADCLGAELLRSQRTIVTTFTTPSGVRSLCYTSVDCACMLACQTR